MKALLLSLLLLTPCALIARVGETFAECETRYGKAISKNDKSGEAMFYKAPFDITVHFHEGRADAVIYKKLSNPGQPFPIHQQLEDDEITSLLAIYAAQWKPLVTDNFTTKCWTHSAGKLSALYTSVDPRLFIATDEALVRIEAREKAKRAESIQGL